MEDLQHELRMVAPWRHCSAGRSLGVSRSVEHEFPSVLSYSRFLLSMLLLHIYCILLRISSLCLSYLVFCVLCLSCWQRSIVVRTLVLAGELSLCCARLLAGWVTTLWLTVRYRSANMANSAIHTSGVGK